MSEGTLAPLRCQEFVELVTDYLEQQLDEARRLWTDEHLAQCDACQAYLDQMRSTIHALRGLADDELTDAQRRRALEAFRAKRPAGH